MEGSRTTKHFNSLSLTIDLPSVIQPDTLQRPTSQDSAEARNYGVDPIFIMNERKTREIEEYKQKQERIAAWLARQAAKPKADTTCYICPTGKDFNFNQLVIDPVETTVDFKLIDNQYFDENIFAEKKGEQVKFNYLNEETTHIFQHKPLREIERPIKSDTPSAWFFVPLFGLFILLAIFKVFYSRFINYFIQSSLYVFVANKIQKENSLLGNRVLLLLDIVYFVSTSVFILKAIDYYNIRNQIGLNIPLLFLSVIGILVAFRIYKYIVTMVSGYSSQTITEMRELYFHQLIYPRIFGIILIPLLFVFAFTDEKLSTAVLYFIIAAFFIQLIMKTLRTFRVFINKGFSIFYFLLYLCALEIVPVLVFLKEVFWE
jgi:hypothetical protein